MTTLSSFISSGIYVTSSPPYGTPFTITASGTIAAQPDTTALYAGEHTKILNDGLLLGGAAAPFFNGIGTLYNAAAGISFSQNGAVSITNVGTILGGAGYHLIFGAGDNTGGTGLIAEGSLTITNLGLIAGGAGGTGADGGVGLNLGDVAAGMVANYGTILGGQGGDGTQAGFGGAGVLLNYGLATLVNAGLIAGGKAGTGTGDAALAAYGLGGANYPVGTGVIIDSAATLINAGTIAAGAAPSGVPAPDAVYIGGPGTLIADPGAVFTGAVAATGVTAEVLQLGGYGGTLAGIGSQFTGFTTIGFAPRATGLIAGDSAALAAGQAIVNFNFGDTIDLTGFAATGAYFGAGNDFVLANATAHATLSLASEPGLGLVGFGTDSNGGTEIRVFGLHNFFGSLGSVLTISPNTKYESAFTITAGATVDAQGIVHPIIGVVPPVNTAVYGTGIAAVTLTNNGLVENPYSGAPASYYGIVLAGGGAFTNFGSVIAPSGIVIAISTASAYVTNSGLIQATQEYGVDFFGQSTLVNSGSIIAALEGVHFGDAVTNTAHAIIAGGTTGIYLTGAYGSLFNAGTITGAAKAGLYFTAYQGTATNAAGGTIASAQGTGVEFSAYRGSFSNSGAILGAYAGVSLTTGDSSFTNATTGYINGNLAVDLNNIYASFSNAGTLIGGIGVNIFQSGAITNSAGGQITGEYGIQSRSGANAVAFANAGTVTGYVSVELLGGGYVTNTALGLIQTPDPLSGTGVFLKSGGSIFNAGTIRAGAGAIINAYGTSALPSYIRNSGTIAALDTQFLITTFTSNYYLGDQGAGIALNLAGSAVNAGYITASNAGILGTSYAGITNSAAGVINSYQGILVYSTTTSTISNAGTITARYDGITVQSTAMVTNSGTIFSAGGALLFGGGIIIGAGTVSNSGTITTPGYDIRLETGTVFNTGTVSSMGEPAINVSTGSIYNSGLVHASGGEFVEVSGAITNAGTVMAVNFALYAASGSIANFGFASGSFGAFMRNSGVVTNAGTLSGTSKAVDFYSGHNNTLIADPGAVFIGEVDGGDSIGGTGISLLELGAGSIAGTLASFGSQFTNFQTLSFGPGAEWTVSGSLGAFDDGLSITGFASGDTLDIAANLSGLSTISSSGTLSATAGHIIEHFTFSPVDAGETFIAKPDGHGGTEITANAVACFCRGTRIATPRGNIAVEKLQIGDLVTTLHGDKPIRWIGRRAYANRFIANNPNALPIRIRRHAIAFNIPSRDLYVSPDHAICEGGVLIHAHLLTNGVSITQLEDLEAVEYFHIELDHHGILFAENLATESFLDEGARHRFANAHTAPPASPQKPCLPRVFDGFHLHHIKSRIARRAGVAETGRLGPMRGCIDESSATLIRGWAQDIANPEAPVLLEIFSGGLAGAKAPEIFSARVLANKFRPDLRDAGLGSGCHGFAVALPNLRGPITLRRAADGATLAAASGSGRVVQSLEGRKASKRSLF